MITFNFPNGWRLVIAHDGSEYACAAFPSHIYENEPEPGEVLRRHIVSLDLDPTKPVLMMDMIDIMRRRGDRLDTTDPLQVAEFIRSVSTRPLEPTRARINEQLDQALALRRSV